MNFILNFGGKPIVIDGYTVRTINKKDQYRSTFVYDFLKKETNNTQKEINHILSSDISNLISRYGGIYFTGFEKIDKEILGAMLFLKNEIGPDYNFETDNITNENKNENGLIKLLYILEKTIIRDFLFSKLNFQNESKKKLKSILLTAVKKYSMDDLKMIFSFKNINFDIIDNLNSLHDNNRNKIKNIINSLQNKNIGIFPVYLTNDNIHNIENNLLSLYDNIPDKVKNIIKDEALNARLISNNKGSIVDLLLLQNNDCKFLFKELELIDINFLSIILIDSNFLSIIYPGYKYYKLLFDRIRDSSHKNKRTYHQLLKPKANYGEWTIFRIDKDLPLDILETRSKYSKSRFTYDQCQYIFDNITQDSNKLAELFQKDYDVIQFLYNNITKNVDEIIDLCDTVSKFSKTLKNIKSIYEKINDYDKFKEIIHRFDKSEITGDEFLIIEFFYKHFKNDILEWVNNQRESKFSKIGLSYFNNIKYLYEKGFCKSIDDYISLKKFGYLTCNQKIIDNLEFLFNNGLLTTKNDLIQNKELIFNLNIDLDSKQILNNLFSQRANYEKRSQLFLRIITCSISDDNKNEIIHKIEGLTIEMAKKYIRACEILNNSNSFDIQVIKDSLIMDILNSEDPESIIKKIDSIFLESDIPFISKIFQVFKCIYPEETFNKKIEAHGSPSHYLQSCGTYEKKLAIIYQDLMHIMIKSGESSLKEFIQSVISCKQVLYDYEKGKILDNEGYKQIISLMKKIVSLSIIINGKNKNNEIFGLNLGIGIETLKVHYKKLKKSLLLREEDSLYDFFLNLCKKIGYNSLEEIIIDMEYSQEEAHRNCLNFINNKGKNGFIFKPLNNYFLKGIDFKSLGEILNRGVTSSEYLGGGEGTDDKITSNLTPFDTDGVMVNGNNLLNIAKSHGYGNLAIIVDIEKPQYYNTDKGLEGYNTNMYEIFKNHGEDSNYYGIRTGIPSTEFVAIIYKSKEIDIGNLQEIKYLIARNGFYLPVLYLEGNLLFTPEEYHRLRQSFSFSEKYKGYDINENKGNYESINQNEIINNGKNDFKTFIENQKNGDNVNAKIDNETMSKLVFNKIKDILEFKLGIRCNQYKNLLGAELYDSGSTGRGTQIPSNDIDLDFTLLLNPQDYERLEEIQKTIHENIGTTKSTDHTTVDGEGFQIKSIVNDLGNEYGYNSGIRFDLLIMKKKQSYLYPSNIAMEERLENIEKLYGTDTLDFVRENILIMKKLLKSQGTYKNTEGGMGGIGVENRIMQHHGNFIEALEAFEQVAYLGEYEEGKKSITFEKFKNLYTIRDSGQNFKDNKNDNYIRKMNEIGYNGILNIIKKYRTEGIKGLFKLILDYEQYKTNYIK